MSTPDTEPPGWLDRPETADRIWWAICVICTLLVVADLFYVKHAHQDFERMPGFHAFFGFVAFTFVVLAGTRLRDVLMREEDYYDH
ncbi:MAG: prolipoprotein diacylglyceryltransferase [Myxococcota bacterium]